ncbi:MAG TPA: adenylosuccinate lyase [Candidatus Krumholzibacteria bacterium]|nr:adenylosuccinate lyase [Candidatus Krumholzibacteria bacterium]
MIERYQTPEMAGLWADDGRFEIWRDVEVAACEALAELGEIPAEAARTIREKAGFDVARIHEIEATTNHDVIAFLTSMAEHIGPDSRWVHLGMTSSDLLDTTLAVQCKRAGELILEELDRLITATTARAVEHKRTVMIGRSHGVHAEPTTFGLKLLVWVDELKRDRARLTAAIERVAVGQISGPVGTFAHIAPEVEARVCAHFGLGVSPVSTQVVQRDRHAEFLNAIALCGATLETMAIEVRHLQRTEVREAEEPFGKGQKGSSAMPHKRNPILCERLTGMARLLRTNAQAAIENVALWHERDISHSSVERVILPDSTTLLHYMLRKTVPLIEGLRVFPERMRENLESTGGLYHSGAILLALAREGLTREEAYRIVQAAAMRSWEEGRPFEEVARADEELARHLDADALDACFDLQRHLRHVDTIFARVLGDEGAAH